MRKWHVCCIAPSPRLIKILFKKIASLISSWPFSSHYAMIVFYIFMILVGDEWSDRRPHHVCRLSSHYIDLWFVWDVPTFTCSLLIFWLIRKKPNLTVYNSIFKIQKSTIVTHLLCIVFQIFINKIYKNRLFYLQ